MKRISRLILCILISCQINGSTAQIITTTVEPVTRCQGEIVTPVNVTQCNNMGAISLVLKFNSTLLNYLGFQDVNPALGNGTMVVNAVGNKVFISWTSVTPAFVGSGILVKLRFNTLPGVSNLTWDTLTSGNCEYTDVAGQVLPSVYGNATVTILSNSMVAHAGSDVTIVAGGSTQLSGSAVGGTTPYSYLWTPVSWLNNPYIPDPVASPPSSITYTFNVTDQYNCTATDQVSITVAVPVTRTWIGTQDDNWHVATNWSPVGVPGPVDDVIIPGNAPVMPVIRIQGLSCKNVLIQSGGTLTINDGVSFVVTGPMVMEGP